MREIKFRAWHKKLEEYLSTDGRSWHHYGPNIVDGILRSEDCIIEHFTGLHDNTKWEDLTEKEKNEWLKNLGNTSENWPGKKIYEGDIVKSENGMIVSVEWNELDACYHCYDSKRRFHPTWTLGHYTLDNIIIIGNIHENQELINE